MYTIVKQASRQPYLIVDESTGVAVRVKRGGHKAARRIARRMKRRAR
jgi:hypothetical protein